MLKLKKTKTKKIEEIVIVTPAISDDQVSNGLYELSKKLGQLNPEAQSHGFLGGQWGYGQDFENDVFMMHSFCWCDQDNCKWCSGKEPNFRHKASGFSVCWYKYIGRGMEFEPIDGNKWDKILKECLRSIKSENKKQKTRK